MSSFHYKRPVRAMWLVLALTLVLGLLLVLPFVSASEVNSGEADARLAASAQANKVSHRLIVELDSPSLIEKSMENGVARSANGRLNPRSTAAIAYVNQLQAEQAAFVGRMSQALPGARVSRYINEAGQSVESTYQITFNGIAVDPGSISTDVARKTLMAMPGVKAVYSDYAHQPDTYTSTQLINAPAVWSQVGGQDNAGAGIKIASMDGGLHHEASMLQGDGWAYPAGWPAGGLGDTSNNNSKIIASRAYFREWDPPSPGDENTWPGTQGTSHGVHTGSTAGGNAVTDNYLGVDLDVTGVAPGAWLMSYRVFYNSVTNDGSFYTVEGIAALEDLVADGADVVNNSWGGGPGSVGGEFDPLDQALINAVNAGVFVSMSAGNAGPGLGTGDHPSDDYISVAASTTSGTMASGRFNVTAPEPVDSNLIGLSYGTALFGPPLPSGQKLAYEYTVGAAADAANFEGCSAWDGTPFTGKAVLISRGSCSFGTKVFYAQQAGAEFVVIYDNTSEAVQGMSFACEAPNCTADDIAISAIRLPKTPGAAVVEWFNTNGAGVMFEVDTFAFQAGNTPDVMADFSSRGPGAGNVLKPDITAPGVNIMAQGYTPNAVGEARHLHIGQVSGTSMAAPHVAGAAAIMKQIHPGWSNADIKSALMSTSKYMDMYNSDGSPAQPLDMGAGRMDLTNAADPGVILSPPSLSYGLVHTGTVSSIEVTVKSVADTTETYELTSLYTGDGFAMTQTTSVAGISITPSSLLLAPGETGTFTVVFDSAAGMGIGDNQGYIIMSSDGHEAHLPLWARVAPSADGVADVLVIDNDFSLLLGMPDYRDYYTEALDNLGVSYDVWEADANFGNPTTLPETAVLSNYKAIIYYTGDNFFSDGSFTVATPLTALDMDILTEYANGGGIVIAMGQDLAAVLASDDPNNNTFFYGGVLGGKWLQDSVTGGFSLPSQPIGAAPDAPDAFANVQLDMGAPAPREVNLSGANEVPPVATINSGRARFSFNNVTNELSWAVQITAREPMTITAAHIHTGTVGVNGPVLINLMPPGAPVMITDTLTWSGVSTLPDAQLFTLLLQGYYINVHTEKVPSGELRAQVAATITGDGARNQQYIDELATYPNKEPDGQPGKAYSYTPLLRYNGGGNIEDGVVAMAHREQPTLENPGVSYDGRSVYTSFGLEGVNNGLGTTTREELLGALLDWAMDEPTATIVDMRNDYSNSDESLVMRADVGSNIAGTEGTSYRWDFGDGSPIAGPYTSNIVGHDYPAGCALYTVTVEATDSWGNVAIGATQVNTCGMYSTFLPIIKN